MGALGEYTSPLAPISAPARVPVAVSSALIFILCANHARRDMEHEP